VLFCNLVGSTEIAARLDPEDWHRMSREYQTATGDAVKHLGGHVDKYLGDGLVCFFGFPQAHEDDAERAVRAGLAIVDAVLLCRHRPDAAELRLVGGSAGRGTPRCAGAGAGSWALISAETMPLLAPLLDLPVPPEPLAAARTC
jgi:class 3 adenylate cyclase